MGDKASPASREPRSNKMMEMATWRGMTLAIKVAIPYATKPTIHKIAPQGKAKLANHG